MSVAKQQAKPVFFAPYAANGAAQELTIGATATDTGTLGITGVDWVLVQARGANIYYRLDGVAATANSFVLVADRDPILMPLPVQSLITFLGSAAGSILVVQPVEVH